MTRPSPRERHLNRARAADRKRQQQRRNRAKAQDNYTPVCVASLLTAMWCSNHDAPWPARNRTCDGAP